MSSLVDYAHFPADEPKGPCVAFFFFFVAHVRNRGESREKKDFSEGVAPTFPKLRRHAPSLPQGKY